MNENKLTPSIRFKNNDGENYPEWDFVKVKEIASINTGNKDTKDAVENGQYDFYVRSPIVHKIDSFSYDGEAVLTVGDGVGVGKVFHYVNGKFDFHQRVYKISDFKDYYGLLFYYYFQKKFLKVAQKYNAKTSVDSVRKSMIADMYVPKIEMSEQIKIGNFFSKLDRQIELEEQKLAKLEEQKKGYMQKIFSQELRFKDENGNDYPNWIFEELNNIFTKYQNTIYLHDNEEYKRISISNKGKITHRDITFGKMIGRKRQYLIDLKKHPNTLTFIRQGVFLGGIGFIPSSLDGYIVTENMPLLSMSEEYSKKFMTYLFSSESYYKSVIFKNLPTGSAQKALHEKDWLKSFVNIPVYSEQEKIGNFFEKQDNLIKKQSDKVELLKERKKGFLQKMFV